MQGEPYFVPKLKWFEVRGDEVEPGDFVVLHRGQHGRTVDVLWCGRWPGGTSWDRSEIMMRERDFPFGLYPLYPSSRYRITRSGVYVEGWSPEECAARRAVWEKEKRDGAEDDGRTAARLEG
ncbi:hypothetical protein [Streptomyces yaizuensis]|uniref:Uncharacterized protein n=1 Tax=Streptomyces yaizuensis TaxID=2989713 RepID=A0AA86IVK3_9ACTN|nr:hypothetical protein [Streptomyces sp. YSPA8]BDT39495.1 hypothetical protein SYYSPA8_36885 [Streptomyces sp. YSPA8]